MAFLDETGAKTKIKNALVKSNHNFVIHKANSTSRLSGISIGLTCLSCTAEPACGHVGFAGSLARGRAGDHVGGELQ